MIEMVLKPNANREEDFEKSTKDGDQTRSKSGSDTGDVVNNAIPSASDPTDQNDSDSIKPTFIHFEMDGEKIKICDGDLFDRQKLLDSLKACRKWFDSSSSSDRHNFVVKICKAFGLDTATINSMLDFDDVVDSVESTACMQMPENFADVAVSYIENNQNMLGDESVLDSED